MLLLILLLLLLLRLLRLGLTQQRDLIEEGRLVLRPRWILVLELDHDPNH